MSRRSSIDVVRRCLQRFADAKEYVVEGSYLAEIRLLERVRIQGRSSVIFLVVRSRTSDVLIRSRSNENLSPYFCVRREARVEGAELI